MALVANFKSQMLWENIDKGDLTTVVNLLENGNINLEERDQNGQTFLMVACQKGEISIVRELLEAGLDPNGVDNDFWCALLYAAKEGHLEVCIELLERGANVEHRDLCGWTALMWAAYKGRDTVADELLDRGADPNIKAEHNMSCLSWAAGRGHTEVAKSLIQRGARVNSSDKYGTTPLVWACRKGHLEIVQELLKGGASVENTGMDSLTAVLVATKGGYTEVVQALLEHDPNCNATDKDGFTALTLAAKEGYEDIVQELLAKDAYVNIADRVGDTILIHAVKGGYCDVVRALLNRYADVDVEGNEKKTALYWAVEKGHTAIVKLLLDNDPDVEITTKDGDSPLLRAVRNRFELGVRLLLDKGAKVNVVDKKGDSALHVSLRARSKRITELLLRNPRNSRLLYRPNKSGETPYSIDAYHQKGILTQIHGHRKLNTSDSENLLGYEIYSSSLADILSDPTLNTPITVGLYAKWGSGKSFLIGKLKNEMKAFTKSNMTEEFSFTWSLFIFLLIINSVIGSTLAFAAIWQIGIGVGFGLFLLQYGFLGLIWFCSTRHNARFALRISEAIGKRLHLLTLLLKVLFCNPITSSPNSRDVPLVKFLFSEGTRLTSVGGEKELAAMVARLSESLEKEFGFLTTRLFGVFKPPTEKPLIERFKTICCIPIFLIVVFVLLCIITAIALLVTYQVSADNRAVNGSMIALASIVTLLFLGNIHTFGRSLLAIFISQKRRVLNAADNLHKLKMDGFMQRLKQEVSLMNKMVACMDKFTKNTTRLVVVVDGLDSCEQEKVLQVLEIIHVLFNDENASFVTVLAIDPQIIIKGIDQNLKTMYHDSNVTGFDFLRNIVHLPFYLQSQGIEVKKQDMIKSTSAYDISNGLESPTYARKMAYSHQDSTVSQISGFSVIDPSVKKAKRQRQDSISYAYHSNFDLSHTLTKNDYFSDINPKSMRRLMNIVAVTGRLLRAYNIDFNWYRLAAWVNCIEQWPYRLSWIILYFEENDGLADDVTLKSIYDKVESQIPVSSNVDPLLEIDRNTKKLEAFLSSKSSSNPVLNIADLWKFLPCTINLDPYLRKLIRNLQKQTAAAFQQSELPLGMYGPQPPPPGLTPQTGVNPTENLNTLRSGGNRTPIKPHMPMGVPYPGHMMPYGPMGMHPQQMMYMNMMGMGGYGMPTPSSTLAQPVIQKPTPPSLYIKGYKDEILSKMTTNEIAGMLCRLEGINLQLVADYQQNIKENNINGLVLSHCDIDELGKCLGMKFGDWQLFKSAIMVLRDVEESGYNPEIVEEEAVKLGESAAGRGRTSSIMSTRSIHFAEQESLSPSSSFDNGSGLSKPSYMPQLSNDSAKDTTDGNGIETIREEIEPQQGKMKRNDSVVAEMMYESNLLHSCMESFAEDELGEETENESDSNKKSSSRQRGLPVQFSLTSYHDDAQSAYYTNNNNHNHSPRRNSRSQSPEAEPLLNRAVFNRAKSETPKLKSRFTHDSPKPILKYSKSSVPVQLESIPAVIDSATVQSEPNLREIDKKKVAEKSRNLCKPEIEKSISMSSGGFSDNAIDFPWKSSETVNSIEIIDETKTDKLPQFGDDSQVFLSATSPNKSSQVHFITATKTDSNQDGKSAAFL